MLALATAPERLGAVTQPADLGLFLQRDAAAQALDCMQRGLIVADDHCQVLFSNRTAQQILCEADGLVLALDGLHAARPRDTAELRGLIRHAAGAQASPEMVTVLSLWRPSLKRMLLLRITSVRALSAPPARRLVYRAALFLHDPVAPVSVDKDALSRLYGLTRAECHLVELLLNGSTLAEASTTLGITLNTVRTHLKHVFMKTDVNHQCQLISLLLGSVIQSPARTLAPFPAMRAGARHNW